MRIGLALDVYRSYISGVTRHVSLLKTALTAQGHEVFVFTFDDLSHQRLPDPYLVTSPAFFSSKKYSWGFVYSNHARKLLRTMDVIHTHQPFVTGSLVYQYTQGHIPIVFTNHTRYDLYLKTYLPWLPIKMGNALLFRFLSAYTRTVDCVIAPSQGMYWVMRGWNLGAPIQVIPNGIDLYPFQKPICSTSRLILGIPEDDFLWIYVGRLSGEKNISFLLEGFSRSLQLNPNMSLLLVGDGVLRHELTHWANVNGLKKKIHFTGAVNYQEIPGYLSIANAFATASQSEVHPLTVIEATAAGLPVVGIQSPGVGDIVVHGETGLLCDPEQTGFCENMVNISTHSDLCRYLSKNAQRRSYLFSYEENASHLADIYQKVQNKN